MPPIPDPKKQQTHFQWLIQNRATVKARVAKLNSQPTIQKVGRRPQRHPLYTVWYGMIQRCHNPNSPGYYNYGAEGIKVCDRWQEPNYQGFKNFVADMGLRPDEVIYGKSVVYKIPYTIDRYPDTYGDYEPNNTRWATKDQQAQNKRKPITRHLRDAWQTYQVDSERQCITLSLDAAIIIDKLLG
jgi:hypothetical protein